MSGAFKSIGGIDEAGKGSVIGPMVIAGVSCEREVIKRFKDEGVRDSKKLTPKRRRELYEVIKEKANVSIKVFNAWEIDQMRREKTINEILLDGFTEIANNLECFAIYADSPDVNMDRFRVRLEESCGKRVFSLHKADEKITVVMAASIVAKVERDARIEMIKNECGVDFGSGYPADPKTREFLVKCLEEGNFMKYIRFSWKTVRKNLNQRVNLR